MFYLVISNCSEDRTLVDLKYNQLEAAARNSSNVTLL